MTISSKNDVNISFSVRKSLIFTLKNIKYMYCFKNPLITKNGAIIETNKLKNFSDSFFTFHYFNLQQQFEYGVSHPLLFNELRFLSGNIFPHFIEYHSYKIL